MRKDKRVSTIKKDLKITFSINEISNKVNKYK